LRYSHGRCDRGELVKCFQPEISSFRLHLAAEGKAAKTVRTYTEAVQWFAAAYLRRQGNRTCWEEVKKRDVQGWAAWLLGRYSAAYASLDRYIRVRARHAQAYRPQLWLGVNNRGPMTASGIYQVIVRRGRQCGVDVFPHRAADVLSLTI
jgi:hypothetical protein